MLKTNNRGHELKRTSTSMIHRLMLARLEVLLAEKSPTSCFILFYFIFFNSPLNIT